MTFTSPHAFRGEMFDPKPREASYLAKLDDALLDSILQLSESELDAELKELGLDPLVEVASMRGTILKAANDAAKATLISAKANLAKFKQRQSATNRDPVAGRELLQRIKSRDPDITQMMMAARKGKALSESDEAQVAEDLVDLEKLDKNTD